MSSLVLISILLLAQVRARPLDDSRDLDDPPGVQDIQSVQDGFYLLPAPLNESQLDDSRHAFESLQSEDLIDAPRRRPQLPHRKDDNSPGGDGDDREPRGRVGVLFRIKQTKHLEQKPTCKGRKFKQKVRHPGCLSKMVDNRYCTGLCSSIYIPRPKKLKAMFLSCSTCAPFEYDTMEVTLECPGRNPPFITRTITKVKRCECVNVDLDEDFSGL